MVAQVISANVLRRPSRPTTVERIEEDFDDAFRRWRPDALGGYRVWLPDGRMLAVDYFSSEAEARAGEQREPPQDVAEVFPKWMAQMSDQEWMHLTAPWIANQAISRCSGPAKTGRRCR